MGTHNLINDQRMWAKVVTLGTNQAISQGLDNETWQNLKKQTQSHCASIINLTACVFLGVIIVSFLLIYNMQKDNAKTNIFGIRHTLYLKT